MAAGHNPCMAGYVYILTNERHGTLYIGVTNNLVRRIWEHREGVVPGFSKRYGLKRLVYYEVHETMPLAIRREKQMKAWQRSWKMRVIREMNPDWDDLYERIVAHGPQPSLG